MPTFEYIARDTRTGQRLKSEVEAENDRAAAKILISRGLSPLDIKPKVAGLAGIKGHIATKYKVIFSRQLATLINAGLPLVQSLNTVLGQTSNKALQAVIVKVISDVEAGNRLADCLAKHPEVFDRVYVSLVAAGEESGTLAKSLDRLALQQEKDAEISSKVRGAMIYPAIVLFVLAGIVTFMVTTVLPQVQLLYKGIKGAQLPTITSMLLSLSHLLTHYWPVIVLLLVATVFTFRRWSRSEGGRLILDKLKLRMWPVAPLFRKMYMARFARTGSTLASSGVPMIEMLNTTAEAVGNIHVARSIIQAKEQVKGGKSLSASLAGDPNFLDLVPDMIHIGEQSGELDAMLAKVADYYEKEVDNQIKSISTIVEPVMMLVVGVIALIIVAAVLLPIYGLAGKNLTG